MRSTIRVCIELLVLGALIAFFWMPLKNLALQTYGKIAPCTIPITYQLGAIDPRFGISTSTLLSNISEAIGIWDKAAGKKLFAYREKGGEITVNLSYDSRQETTTELGRLGATLHGDRAMYDAAKVKYDDLHRQYLQKKVAFQTRNAAYVSAASKYEQTVKYWNARGGAPKDVYEDLQNDKIALANQLSALQKEQIVINAEAAELNELVSTLNDLIRTLNLDVATYNDVGNTNGDQFEQGVYESSFGKRSITVFEFSDHVKLVRVLAHEFGHALGMEHVKDSQAIMYPIDKGRNLSASVDDVAELNVVCRLST